MKQVLFYGFGGHGRVVQSALDSAVQLVGFFDAHLPKVWAGVIPYLGVYDAEVLPDFSIIITIGNNAIREKLAGEVVHPFSTVIHPTAQCADDAEVGAGSVVLHGAIIQSGSVIGRHSIINAGAVIDHDSVIGDFVHIGPGAVVASLARVGKGVYIEAGAVVASGAIVPDGVKIDAGMVFNGS